MARYDFRTPRLYVAQDLADGETVTIDSAQSNYLVNVLRLGIDASVLLFNARDGEWRGEIIKLAKKECSIALREQTRPQTSPYDLHYLFAALKHARLDYMVQKAVEMGVGTLRPVWTQHTQVRRVNTRRMHANAVEAAEQCGILSVPDIREPEKLGSVLDQWSEAEGDRYLIFCDEGSKTQNPIEYLKRMKPGPLALLIGPEGGFTDDERSRLQSCDFVTTIPLGPRILRADTAAVAALAVIQSTIGDWH